MTTDARTITCDPEHPFEVVLPGRSRAEADSLGEALFAAHTLLDDAFPEGGGARRAARREVIVSRDGQYDAVGTALARQGQRRALSAEWSEVRDGRFCGECGADVVGNDPHQPGCSYGDES